MTKVMSKKAELKKRNIRWLCIIESLSSCLWFEHFSLWWHTWKLRNLWRQTVNNWHMMCSNWSSEVVNKLETTCYKLDSLDGRVVTRTLIWGGGGYIHTFMLWPTSFISNHIQIDQFEKKSARQNMNIWIYTHTQINDLVTALLEWNTRLVTRLS